MAARYDHDAESGSPSVAISGIKRSREEEEADPFANFIGQPAHAKLQSLVADGLLRVGDFDMRALALLESKPYEQATKCLDRYRAAASADHVRNPSAYISRMMRESSASSRPGLSGQIYPAAMEVLRSLERDEKLPSGALDAAVLEQLSFLTVARQMAATESFAAKNLGNVRKPSALLSAIIRRYEAGGDLRLAGSRQPGSTSLPADAFLYNKGRELYPMGQGGDGGGRRGSREYSREIGSNQYDQAGPHHGLMRNRGGTGYGRAPEHAENNGRQGGGDFIRPPVTNGRGRGYAPLHAPGSSPSGPIFTADQAAGLANLTGGLTAGSNRGRMKGGGVLWYHPPRAMESPKQIQHLPPQQQQQRLLPQQQQHLVPQQQQQLRQMVPPKKHFGMEQVNWGIRVDEFHNLSSFAPYVHPAAAMKLQTMWDAGNLLLSLLDDRSWELLSQIQTAQVGVAVLAETEQVVRNTSQGSDITFVNEMFTRAVNRHRPQSVSASLPYVGGNSGSANLVSIPTAYQPGRQLTGSDGAGSFVQVLQNGGPVQGPALQQPLQSFLPPADGPSGGYGRGRGGKGEGNPLRRGSWAEPSLGGDSSGLTAALPALQNSILAAVEGSGGRLQMSWFDEGVVRLLMQLSPMALQLALTDVSSACYEGVRNPGAYIIGIIRRITS